MAGATGEAAPAGGTEAAGAIGMTGVACVTGTATKAAASETGAGRTGRLVIAGGPGNRPGTTGTSVIAVGAATSELGAGLKPGVPGAAHCSASSEVSSHQGHCACKVGLNCNLEGMHIADVYKNDTFVMQYMSDFVQ